MTIKLTPPTLSFCSTPYLTLSSKCMSSPNNVTSAIFHLRLGTVMIPREIKHGWLERQWLRNVHKLMYIDVLYILQTKEQAGL